MLRQILYRRAILAYLLTIVAPALVLLYLGLQSMEMRKAWVLPASGGEAQELRMGFTGRVTQLSWSPDCRTLACTGDEGGDYALWLVEDFLGAMKK